MRKRILKIGTPIIALMLLGAGVWWMFSSGHLTYTANIDSKATANIDGKATASKRSGCSGDIVAKYNEAIIMTYRNNDDFASIDKAGLADVGRRIRETDSYKSDSTCQTILFWLAVNNRDYSAAVAANGVIQAQYRDGIYADSDIQGVSGVSSYNDLIIGLAGRGTDDR
jgi:hypothetical protein